MPTEQAIGESVRWLLGLQELVRAPFTPQFGPSITGAGGSTPTIVVAASNTSQKTQIKADYVSPAPDWTETARVALQDMDLNRGGGRLVLTEGDFYFSSDIEVNGPLRIEGMGVDATRLHMAAGANSGMFTLATPHTGSFELANLDMDGHDNLQTAGTSAGVWMQANMDTDVLIDQCHIHDFRGDGVFSDRSACAVWVTNSQIFNNTQDGLRLAVEGRFIIDGNQLHSNGRHGVIADGANIVMVSNKVFSNVSAGFTAGGVFQNPGQIVVGNDFNNNGGTGIYLEGHDSVIAGNVCDLNGGYGIEAHGIAGPIAMTGNHSRANTLSGIYLRGGAGGSCSGNTVRFNGQHGIIVEQPWLVTGNKIMNNSRTTTNTYDGIHVTATLADVLTNVIRQTTGAPVQRYGINVAAAAVNTWVAGNDARGGGWGTADYVDAGAGTINTWAGGFGDNQ